MSLHDIPKKKASAIIEALQPDNVNFPKGLSLEIKNIDNDLVFNFKSLDNTKKLVSTVDEILDHIKVTLGVIG
tara:strand:- start:497 stop:715 length:219 start_codon:yes stop_codon:yes gene_type:complete